MRLLRYDNSELITYQFFQSKYIISHKNISSLQTLSETFLHLNKGTVWFQESLSFLEAHQIQNNANGGLSINQLNKSVGLDLFYG